MGATRWVEQSLTDATAAAAAPGIFYLFRSHEDFQRYLAHQARRDAPRPGIRVADLLYEQHRELLEPLQDYIRTTRRLPNPADIPEASKINAELGSIRAAFALIRRVTGPEPWAEVETRSRRDFLVYLALAAFGGRPRFSELPDDLQHDVRDLFGNYKTATEQADKLLFAAGDPAAIDTACRSAAIGKRTPEALYVHGSAIGSLPPLLRVYEGCGRALAGTVEGATLLKLHRGKSQVSYPDFDRDPHPAIATVVIARLPQLDITFRDFRESSNPPVLHRKETFVPDSYPGRDKFARLTRQEERAGLLDDPAHIGTRAGWETRLAENGRTLRGHRLIKAR